MARSRLRYGCWTVSGCLQIVPKNSERDECVSDSRVGQAGLEDLPGFFFTVQLHIKQSFGGEITIQKVDITTANLRRIWPNESQASIRLDGIDMSSAVDGWLGEDLEG